MFPFLYVQVGDDVTLPGGAILSFDKNDERIYNSEVDKYSLFIPGIANISIAMHAANTQLRTADDAQVHFNLNFPSIMVSIPECRAISIS